MVIRQLLQPVVQPLLQEEVVLHPLVVGVGLLRSLALVVWPLRSLSDEETSCV